MNILHSVLAILTIPATAVVAHIFWKGYREARGIAMLLSTEDILFEVLAPTVIKHPAERIELFVKPQPGGYSVNMKMFREADQYAHSRLRSKLRPVLAILLIGSAVVGYIAWGWFGLALLMVNLFIMLASFTGSTQGKLDSSTVERAAEHVQVVGVILYRWLAADPEEAKRWIHSEPEMKMLSEFVLALRKPN